jgi:hypothetical protein
MDQERNRCIGQDLEQEEGRQGGRAMTDENPAAQAGDQQTGNDIIAVKDKKEFDSLHREITMGMQGLLLAFKFYRITRVLLRGLVMAYWYFYFAANKMHKAQRHEISLEISF